MEVSMDYEKKENESPVLLPVGNLTGEPIAKAEPEDEGKNTGADKLLLFRGKPISWVTVPQAKLITHANAFAEDETEEQTSGVRHLIQYDNRQMGRTEFLKLVFSDYRKYPYKVQFKTDDIFRLGGN